MLGCFEHLQFWSWIQNCVPNIPTPVEFIPIGHFDVETYAPLGSQEEK